MRTSLLVLACLSFGVVAAGCRVSVETKTEFKGSDVTQNGTATWTNQKIIIRQDGVGLAGGTSGLRVLASPTATTVSITATPISLAFDEDKAQAEEQIAEIAASIKIVETADTITVTCPHPAGSKASAAAGEAGCKYATVTIPSGAADKLVTLDAIVGNGDFVLDGDPYLGGASALASNGAGDLTARFYPGKGAAITVQGGFGINVGLPASASVDKVEFRGDVEDLDATAWSLTAAGGPIGTAGAGATSLIIDHTSTGLDQVALTKF